MNSIIGNPRLIMLQLLGGNLFMIICWLPMMGVHVSSITHSWLHYNHPGGNMFMISHGLPMMGVHASSVTNGWSCYDYYGGNLSVISRRSLMMHELLLYSIEQHIQAKTKKKMKFYFCFRWIIYFISKMSFIYVFFSLLYVDVKNYKIKLCSLLFVYIFSLILSSTSFKHFFLFKFEIKSILIFLIYKRNPFLFWQSLKL